MISSNSIWVTRRLHRRGSPLDAPLRRHFSKTFVTKLSPLAAHVSRWIWNIESSFCKRHSFYSMTRYWNIFLSLLFLTISFLLLFSQLLAVQWQCWLGKFTQGGMWYWKVFLSYEYYCFITVHNGKQISNSVLHCGHCILDLQHHGEIFFLQSENNYTFPKNIQIIF